MKEYYFLFTLAFLFTVFASIQDIRKREVSNWLNFSLVAFALAYRFFYASFLGEWKFFIFGLIGFGIFFFLGQIMYYSRGFGGGDVKLLFGYGVILPYSNYSDLIFFSLGFFILLLLVGAVYSLIYSVMIVYSYKGKFAKEFSLNYKKYNRFILFALVFGILISIFSGFNFIFIYLGMFVFFSSILFIYLRALDSCMIILKNSKDLSEGDWVEKEVIVGGKVIGKSVHGLSLKDIKLLNRYNKKILIKEGVPFVPAFLITLIIMVFFFLVSKGEVYGLFSFFP